MEDVRSSVQLWRRSPLNSWLFSPGFVFCKMGIIMSISEGYYVDVKVIKRLLKRCNMSDSMGLELLEMSKNCSASQISPKSHFIKLPRLSFHADLGAADIYICNIRKQTHMLPQAF